jgi:hypothetical protein
MHTSISGIFLKYSIKRQILLEWPQNTMKRTFSCVATKCYMSTLSSTDPVDGNSTFVEEDMGDYWATALGDKARVHQLFVYVKVLLDNNEESAFYKHIDACMTINDIKNMIKGKKLHRCDGNLQLSLRMQISGGACVVIGDDNRDVVDDDALHAEDVKKDMDRDNQTLKEVMLAYDGARLLLGHEVVDKDVRMAIVLYWSKVC